MRRVSLTLIAAVAANGVIGRNGILPWRLPEDMRFFKETTTGHPVIMGRKTWESMDGKPLRDRHNIVITRGNIELPEFVDRVSSIEEAIECCRAEDDRAFVIGGEAIYRLAMPKASQLLISHLKREFEGDTHFPEIDPAIWKPILRTDYPDALIPFQVVEYGRIG
ncbi:MAG: dihydrofolate reductase [Phycisphaeraceae bacterium]|nr:dihydrofolate reductase [Phycisphaeraceae bacterium]